MSEVNPPLYLEAGEHASNLDRLFHSDLVTAGVIASDHLEVTEQSTPALGVTVAAGRAVVEGDEASDQGLYYVSNDADVNVALATADATNDRIDLIVARILDSFYSGASDAWELQAVTGTPAASPSAPSAPSNSLVLAEVAVPADAGGNPPITNSDIEDTRVVSRPAHHAASRRTQTSDQEIANNTTTVVTYQNTVRTDDPSGHFTETDSQVTINTPGWYRISAGVRWEGGSTGRRQLQIRVNSSDVVGETHTAGSTAGTSQYASTDIYMEAGDTFDVRVTHNQGAALDVDAVPESFRSIVRIGP